MSLPIVQSEGRRRIGRRRRRLVSALAAAFLVAPAIVGATTGSAAAAVSICPDASSSLFGPNVCVFNPSMSQNAIQADVDRIATLQVPQSAQFSTNRYAIFFEPGTYGSAANPLVFQVGFYTQVAGLGLMPQDTVVNGMIEVFANECATRTRNGSTSYWCNSTTNFWRSLSNLQLNVTQNWAVGPAFAPAILGPGGPGCAYSEEAWSVSQAAPLRRLLVNGNIVFQDYCPAPTTTPAVASSPIRRSTVPSTSTVSSSTTPGAQSSAGRTAARTACGTRCTPALSEHRCRSSAARASRTPSCRTRRRARSSRSSTRTPPAGTSSCLRFATTVLERRGAAGPPPAPRYR